MKHLLFLTVHAAGDIRQLTGFQRNKSKVRNSYFAFSGKQHTKMFCFREIFPLRRLRFEYIVASQTDQCQPGSSLFRPPFQMQRKFRLNPRNRNPVKDRVFCQLVQFFKRIIQRRDLLRTEKFFGTAFMIKTGGFIKSFSTAKTTINLHISPPARWQRRYNHDNRQEAAPSGRWDQVSSYPRRSPKASLPE